MVVSSVGSYSHLSGWSLHIEYGMKNGVKNLPTRLPSRGVFSEAGSL
jgi:hypothetical protein